jgi:2'-5' RNA ligase
MTTFVKVTLIIYGLMIFGFQLYWKLKEWREDRIFWKQLELKLKKQDEVFYNALFNALKEDQRFVYHITNLIARKQVDAIKEAISGNNVSEFTNPPLDQQKFFNRIKQWVIDIF